MELNEQNSMLENEIFSLNFELKALANLAIRREAERWVPEFIWKDNEIEHLSRYALAQSYVKDKKVLDLACGSGYGSFLLASVGGALSVTGCDLDRDAIRYGNIKFPHKNVTRLVRDVVEPLGSNDYDVVVSFETIEHLDNFEGFLTNVFNVLKTGGVFIISTPIVEITSTKCVNPYHKIEWSFNDFQKLIKRRFSINEIFVQSLTFKQPSRNLILRISDRIKRILNPDKQPKGVFKSDPSPQVFVDSGKLILEGYQIIVCKKE